MSTHRSGWRRAVALVFGVALVAFGPAAAAAPAAGKAEVFVIHGLPGVTADVLVDGAVQQAAASSKAIVGPLSLDPGEHMITLHPTAGATADVSSTITVAAGESIDVVAHLTADPTAPPTVTVYPNDTSAVAPDKARLVVAHTAAVPPADVRVNGDVLFSNIANGEALTLLVPTGTYSVDIVPTGTDGPVVFGPVDIPVTAGQLTRVFALGNPAAGNMDALVQTMPAAIWGADAPGMVNTGDGGQAAAIASRAAASHYVGEPAASDDPAPLGMGIAAAAGGLLLAGAVTARRWRHHA